MASKIFYGWDPKWLTSDFIIPKSTTSTSWEQPDVGGNLGVTDKEVVWINAGFNINYININSVNISTAAPWSQPDADPLADIKAYNAKIEAASMYYKDSYSNNTFIVKPKSTQGFEGELEIVESDFDRDFKK